jgi:NAD+ kinase
VTRAGQQRQLRTTVAKRPIRNVGLIVKRDNPRALEIACELSAWLRSRRLVALAEEDLAHELNARPLSADELARRADLITVLGGDGTLLGIARLIGNRETPILGINLGGLGFLTQATIEEARGSLERVLAGECQVDRRIMLEASVVNGARPKAGGRMLPALNDAVIAKRALGTMLEIEVSADHKPFCSYRADGLIVATPTGSTAYALSAGGPIVFPTLDVLVLAPICPHTLSNRPVVLPDTCELEIRVRTGKLPAALTLDGQEMVPLGPEDAVRIRKSRNVVALIRSTHPYFEIWRDKLHWG